MNYKAIFMSAYVKDEYGLEKVIHSLRWDLMLVDENGNELSRVGFTTPIVFNGKAETFIDFDRLNNEQLWSFVIESIGEVELQLFKEVVLQEYNSDNSWKSLPNIQFSNKESFII